MNLWAYILRRFLLSVFVLLGLSILIFVISRVVPGDPVRMALGPRAPQYAVDSLRREMHLDKPLPAQYYYWVKGVLTGDMGMSLTTKRPVTQDIREFLPATLELALAAGLIMVVFSIFFGTLAARYRDTAIDAAVRIMAYTGVA
ncbi:MAG: ABC transporter permease, partial [Desulfotomaculales bacterium]